MTVSSFNINPLPVKMVNDGSESKSWKSARRSGRGDLRRFRRCLTGFSETDERVNQAALKFVPCRRHAAQPGYDSRQRFDGKIDPLGRVFLAERQNDVALRQGVVEADGHQHRGDLERLADATRPAGNRHTL